MNPYSRYIEDENFTKWVFHPTEEINRYWQSYLVENPQERETIYFLKDFLLALKTNDIKLSEIDRQEILTQIEKRLVGVRKPIFLVDVIKRYTTYAAILAILLTTSIYFFNSTTKKPAVLEGFQEVSLDTISRTQLILGSGEQIVLGDTKSTVTYATSGKVVINQTDTLNIALEEKLKTEVFNQLIVPYGKRSELTLSDGSTVHLNSGTKFIFPKKFLGDQRVVFLEGEAFFEVATNKERPFVVKSIDSTTEIKAIGTKFNVSAYASDQQIMTVLLEGEVHVVQTGMNAQGQHTTIMNPGELVVWSHENQLVEVKEVETYPYISWMDGILQFESESLAIITKKLERYYNVKIDFEDALNSQIKISGKLDMNDEISTTLDNIAVAAAIDYEKIRNKKYMMKRQ